MNDISVDRAASKRGSRPVFAKHTRPMARASGQCRGGGPDVFDPNIRTGQINPGGIGAALNHRAARERPSSTYMGGVSLTYEIQGPVALDADLLLFLFTPAFPSRLPTIVLAADLAPRSPYVPRVYPPPSRALRLRSLTFVLRAQLLAIFSNPKSTMAARGCFNCGGCESSGPPSAPPRTHHPHSRPPGCELPQGGHAHLVSPHPRAPALPTPTLCPATTAAWRATSPRNAPPRRRPRRATSAVRRATSCVPVPSPPRPPL